MMYYIFGFGCGLMLMASVYCFFMAIRSLLK